MIQSEWQRILILLPPEPPGTVLAHQTNRKRAQIVFFFLSVFQSKAFQQRNAGFQQRRMHFAIAKLHILYRRRINANQLDGQLRQILRRAHAQHGRIKTRMLVVFAGRIGSKQDTLTRLNV